MKKKIAYILLTAGLTVSAFFMGTTTEVYSAKEKMIPLSQCIPLEDIAMTWEGPCGYPVFELNDTTHQLQDRRNRSYKSIQKEIWSYYKLVEETETGVLVTRKDGLSYYFDK